MPNARYSPIWVAVLVVVGLVAAGAFWWGHEVAQRNLEASHESGAAAALLWQSEAQALWDVCVEAGAQAWAEEHHPELKPERYDILTGNTPRWTSYLEIVYSMAGHFVGGRWERRTGTTERIYRSCIEHVEQELGSPPWGESYYWVPQDSAQMIRWLQRRRDAMIEYHSDFLEAVNPYLTDDELRNVLLCVGAGDCD